MGSFPDPVDQWYVQNQSPGPPQRGLMGFYLPLLQKGNIEPSQICLYQSVSEIKQGKNYYIVRLGKTDGKHVIVMITWSFLNI